MLFNVPPRRSHSIVKLILTMEVELTQTTQHRQGQIHSCPPARHNQRCYTHHVLSVCNFALHLTAQHTSGLKLCYFDNDFTPQDWRSSSERVERPTLARTYNPVL